MKKVLLSIIMLGTTIAAQAQLKQGAISIGGTANFSGTEEPNNPGSTNSNTFKTSRFTLMPQLGYMLTDNIAVGTGIGYQFGKTESTSGSGSGVITTTNTQGIFMINPFARYYFMYNDNAGFFAQADFNVGFGNTKNESTGGAFPQNNTVEGKVSTYGFNIRPGFIYFMSDTWAIEATYGRLGTTSTTNKFTNPDVSDKYSEYGIGFDLTTFNVGIQYWIGRK